MAKDSRPTAHPVCRAVAKSRKKTRSAACSELWELSDDEVASSLLEVTQLRAQVEALELKLAAEADRRAVGDKTGATDTAAWWSHETRQDRRHAKGRMRLAESLDRHAPTSAALVEGAISTDHARIITRAVDALPGDLPDPTIPERAEQHCSPRRCTATRGSSPSSRSTSLPSWRRRSARSATPARWNGESARPARMPG